MSRELTNHRLSRMPSRQRGVGLPVAIFVITVLAAFVVNMGYLVQDNATGRIEYVQSLRALLAAESGGDFGLNVLFDPSDATTYSSLSCSSTPVSYSFTNDPGMAVAALALAVRHRVPVGKRSTRLRVSEPAMIQREPLLSMRCRG